MSSKIDFSNPVVIALAVGALWYMTTRKATARSITPNVPSSAPVRTSSAGSQFANILGKIGLGLGANGPQARTEVGSLFDSLVGTPGYDTAAAARETFNDDGSGILFGGYVPRYNSDNIGGSSFDGGLSVGTGLGLY